MQAPPISIAALHARHARLARLVRAPRSARLAAILAIALLAACGSAKDADGRDREPGATTTHKTAEAGGGLGARTGGVPTSREGQMFFLGQKLAQAAMVNGRAKPDVVARTFEAASTIADITLHQPLEPLPAVTGNRASDGAAGMAYLLRYQGRSLGDKIATDFGETSAATYELAVKINMLPMLYTGDPQDKMGDTMAQVFRRLAARAKLPDSAMGPIIAKLEARAPMSEVIELALALNEALPPVIADVHEKDTTK
jgi:hypothetical protein